MHCPLGPWEYVPAACCRMCAARVVPIRLTPTASAGPATDQGSCTGVLRGAIICPLRVSPLGSAARRDVDRAHPGPGVSTTTNVSSLTYHAPDARD